MPTIDNVLEEELTPEQRAAATESAPEVIALACAGSGKSRTLAYRIAWLIENGAPPESILAFTFTNKAADSIQHRVADALARVGHDPTILGRVRIGTIDSYCKGFLSDLDAAYRQFDMLDLNRLHLYLMSRWPKLRLQDIRYRAPNAAYFRTIKEVADAWVTLNNEYIPLEHVEGADAELGALLRRLRQQLLEDRFFDFGLVIRLVVESMDAGGARENELLSGLSHLLVDEYQDVNPIQERLIQGLRDRSQTLLVAGDDDQGLYAWRGADVSNIINFEDRYPNCASHRLSRNFRSTQPIVESADNLINAELGATRIPKDPEAENAPGPRELRSLWFQDRASEAKWVADQIEELLGSKYCEVASDGTVTHRGLTPADIAILMRSTRGAERNGDPRHAAFTSELDSRGIGYTLEAGGGVFDRPQVAAFVSCFELLRTGSPDRDVVRNHYQQVISPVYPQADFERLAQTMGDWGRLIHTPTEVERRRVYPQQLLHELLEDFGLADAGLDDGIMADIGVLSQALQDVEAVFVSIDSAARFQMVFNFLSQMGKNGYDSSNEGVLRRPDAVTVATVHKAKGLEYPAVFLVDVQNQRFPMSRSQYSGWLPSALMANATARGAYGNDRTQEARLFYTALTRAERYMFVSGAEQLPGGRKSWQPSPFAARLSHDELSDSYQRLDLQRAEPQRRIDETVVPTTFSQIRYYLRCPADYQYRHVWGFSPPITEMFGFGQTVHAAVERLHERFQETAPTPEAAEEVARRISHLKHVPPSNDPVERPGAYEEAEQAAVGIVRRYADDYSDDFSHERQVELAFEIPVEKAVISGAIDLVLRYDDQGELLEAAVIDFKSMEGGDEPLESPDLDWTDLSLQVQLYAKAAREVLGENARTGAVHLLKDGQRVSVPVDDDAIAAAVANVEWAVRGVIAERFPMRGHPEKCEACDWAKICPQSVEELGTEPPPQLYLPQPIHRSSVKAIDQAAEPD